MAYTYKSDRYLSFQKQYAPKFQRTDLVSLENLELSETTNYKKKKNA